MGHVWQNLKNMLRFMFYVNLISWYLIKPIKNRGLFERLKDEILNLSYKFLGGLKSEKISENFSPVLQHLLRFS